MLNSGGEELCKLDEYVQYESKVCAQTFTLNVNEM